MNFFLSSGDEEEDEEVEDDIGTISCAFWVESIWGSIWGRVRDSTACGGRMLGRAASSRGEGAFFFGFPRVRAALGVAGLGEAESWGFEGRKEEGGSVDEAEGGMEGEDGASVFDDEDEDDDDGKGSERLT